jgi:DNA-directed RNA polymerase specialized sigma24 family protein
MGHDKNRIALAADRQLFVRRYWYSDSIKELAKKYGVRESKIKSQLFRIRKRLKDDLEKEGFYL